MAVFVDDTIVAVASPPGMGARAIIRMSGPEVAQCLQRCFRPSKENSGAAETWQDATRAEMFVGEFSFGEDSWLPGKLYYWPTSRSYTKQPAAEIHCLHARPLVESITANLCRAGARPAKPGEFTMRAFLAGRIDLPQAEAILSVIDARDERTLDRALRQLAGGISGSLNGLRAQLLDLLADIEAGLDFVDEDIEFASAEHTRQQIDTATRNCRDLLGQMQRRQSAGQLPRCVLVGLPNAGKSSLFNALCPDALALVSSQAGTTRDYLSAPLRHDGKAIVELIDTAGIDSSPREEVSPRATAQMVTSQQIQDADLLLVCIDGSVPSDAETEQLLSATANQPRIVLATKCDVAPSASDGNSVSALTGAGLDWLRNAIRKRITATQDAESPIVEATAIRCLHSLEQAHSSLQEAAQIHHDTLGQELLASQLRVTLDHLGEVVGVVYTDDILDRIFARFCIGK